MRGKVAVREFYLLDGGITPAYAGKRGIRLAVDSKTIGSPPHVRGKAAVIGSDKLSHKDHPRMCREKQN